MEGDLTSDAGGDSLWYRVLFDQAWLPLARTDMTGRILDGNAALGHLLGRPVRDLRGVSGREFLAPGDHGALTDQWRGLVAGQRTRCRSRILAVRDDRRLIVAEATAWLVRTGDAAPRQAVCSLRPISDLPPGDAAPVDLHLSETEAGALEGLAHGLSNAELGERLHLSRQGLDYHLAQLRRKLRTRSRGALVARAYSLGILAIARWPPRVERYFINPCARRIVKPDLD